MSLIVLLEIFGAFGMLFKMNWWIPSEVMDWPSISMRACFTAYICSSFGSNFSYWLLNLSFWDLEKQFSIALRKWMNVSKFRFLKCLEWISLSLNLSFRFSQRKSSLTNMLYQSFSNLVQGWRASSDVGSFHSPHQDFPGWINISFSSSSPWFHLLQWSSSFSKSRELK